MKRIIYKNDSDGISVICPSPQWEGTIEELAIKDVPEGKNWVIVDTEIVPSDRTFRDAWGIENEEIIINMDKAKIIYMDKIRKRRSEKFIEMGFPVKLNSYLEKSIIPQDVCDKLSELRDIPQKLDLSSAETPEQLISIWPSILEE